MSGRSVSVKEYDKIARDLVEQGAIIRKKKNGYIVVLKELDDGRQVLVTRFPMSSSSPRTYMLTVQRLRRHGFKVKGS